MIIFKFLKKLVKRSILSFFHFYFARLCRKSVRSNYIISSLVEPNEHVFFGYYDKTPFDESETRLLATRVPLIHEQNLSEARVGYYTLNNERSWIEIGKTKTWCWQLGTRLQWIGQGNDLAIYNDFIDGKYAGVLYSTLAHKTVKVFDMPVFDVNRTGTEAITLDFSRLHRLRPGYGYMNIDDASINEKAPKNSGLWSIDLQNGATKLLFSVADIVDVSPLQSMKNADHYFNHLMYNPSGKRFMFFHCWLSEGKRYNRLFTCDRNGSNLFPLINTGHVSHYTWVNDRELLAYATHADETCFRIYSDKTEDRCIIGKMKLNEDGHPSLGPGRKNNLLLLDTYPSLFPVQKLYQFDMKTQKMKTLGSFFTSKIYRGPQRCDLHPRWSPSGNHIAFDSVFLGDKRGIHILILDDSNKND